MKPKPPSHLNKELQGVWNAWCDKGDREVIRESAAKGSYIDLAYTFLSTRKQQNYDLTKDNFKEEVKTWMLQLLLRQQIFRASRIVSNIQLNPTVEFTKVFITTYDDKLRDYLGSHLEKSNDLKPNLKETWSLLNILKENRLYLQSFNLESFESLNLEKLQEWCPEWKNEVGTFLFFKIYNPVLKSFITAKSAWLHLLSQNNTEFIRLWLSIFFSKKVDLNFIHLDHQIFDLLTDIFSNLVVDDDLIDLISNFDCLEDTKNIILNEFCKFGVFCQEEKNNLISIIQRLLFSGNILNLEIILSQESSNIGLLHFHNMLIDYCVSKDLYTVLNWCDINFKLHEDAIQKYNSKPLNFLVFLNQCSAYYDESVFGENILRVSQFLSTNLDDFLATNPLILIALLLTSKQPDMLQLFKSGSEVIQLKGVRISSETITSSLNMLPFLKTIVNFRIPTTPSYNDLLKSQGFHLNFKLADDTMPHFNSKLLMDKFGHKKSLSYTFYLKNGRPSFATKMFTLSNHQHHRNELEAEVNRKILKLIAQNSSNSDAMASCIAFLEMIGMNSERIRVYVKTAQILHSSDDYNSKEIQNLLLNVIKAPQLLLNALERVLLKTCVFGIPQAPGGPNLIEEIKKQELCVKFAKIHYLKLPELFLQHCAENDEWVLFLVFVQTFNYPLNEVQKLLQNFTNQVLLEHLMHGISQDIRVDDQRSLIMKDRDSRKYYLSRVGVFHNMDSASSSNISSSFGSYGSTGSSTGSSDFLENENFDFVTDLLQVLIKCHNCVDPPKALLNACQVYKNPLFAVLATSYEPDSIITNWLIWLSISCGVETDNLGFDNVQMNPNSVTDFLFKIVKLGYQKTLHESFQIFLPDNPLAFFIDFLCECANLNFNHETLTKKLDFFENERKHQEKFSMILDGNYDTNFLVSQNWLESTATKLLAVSIQNSFSSRHNQLQFLKFLSDVEVDKYFAFIEFPNFQQLFDILSHLLESNCDINLDLTVIFNKEVIEEEILSYVDQMLLEKRYNCCYEIRNILKISTDFIALQQCQDLFQSEVRVHFWSDCDEIFKLRNVQAATAVEFLESCAEKTRDQHELYQILRVAYNWASEHKLNAAYDLEKRMWLAYFNIEVLEHTFVEESPQKLLYSEMLQKLQFFQNCSSYPLSEDQVLSLNKTIEDMLSDGNLWQAVKISTIFNHQQPDLDLIILCCNLAEGLLKPDQLTVEQRLLWVKRGRYRNNSYRRHRALLSAKGFSSGTVAGSTLTMTDQEEVHIQDILTFLEILSNHITKGLSIAKTILLAYRISANTEKPYQDVFKCEDSMSFIKEVLNGNCINKLEVIHDFSLLFNWSEKQITDFLCEELVVSIREHVSLNLEPISMWNFQLNSDFGVILQVLLENCSLLGLKLFSYVKTLFKSETKSKYDVQVIVELLIRSHDCFTADCNMEGISTLLGMCQAVTELLHGMNCWKLIVRLLTGVARYTEMNYVFHILKENDQFEFLLCKGNRKDNHLKLALLKYLKKYCPENRELYRMVALHFILFSEIAELWEEEARSIIRNLIAISKLEMQNNNLNVETEPYILFTNTDGTKLCLNKAMVNYTHATEYHLQGKKLNKAMNSAKQAELLALQISLLKGLVGNATATCILRINESQIFSLISTELNFYQSLILVEAYNYKVDWSSVLFEQVVVRNQMAYLDNYLTSFAITDNLVIDISKKFLGLKAISDITIKNMKEIVKRCTGICTKYRIASELGFCDLVEDQLTGSQLAYLKDTAFKTGFRN